MDELIFQFLLQAGYPRASIVVDPTLLTPDGIGPAPDDASTYAVVDPDTAERLAAIEVVEAVDGEALQLVATEVGRYASRIGGREMQGFVIRVDPDGRNDAEQVQFFRVWPNSPMQRLSAKTFPDLDALRVARRLSQSSAVVRSESVSVDVAGPYVEAGTGVGEVRPGAGPARRYVPAALLVLFALVDGWLEHTRGVGFLSLTQTLLMVGAAGVVALSR